MNTRLFSVCIAVVIAVQTAFCLRASAFSREDMISAAFDFTAQAAGADSVVDANVCRTDWAAVCWARLYGGAEEYAEKTAEQAEELMRSDGFVKPTDLQRAAILLSAAGECPRALIDAAAYCSADLDRQGLNAWIWALAAANCAGVEAGEYALHTRSGLASEIISRQLEDGGFNLRGTGADADMTAAAIYALAPLSEDGEVASALDRAVECLSGLQLPSGGFASMGNENCESTAQAIIAFTSVGLPESDERVQRALSAMLEYRRSDGGFAHLPDGESSTLATVQAAQALTALELAARGERLFDAVPSGGETQPVSEHTPSDKVSGDLSAEESAQTASGIGGAQIKLIISAVFGAAAIALVLTGALKKRRALFAAALAAAAVSGGVWLLDIKSAEEYYSEQAGQADLFVTFSVTCGTAAANPDRIDESVNPLSVIPEDGVLVAERQLGLPEGATAFDALTAAAREEKLRVDYNGTAYGVYVRSIGGICEFGFGEMSGWMYRVNGEIPDRSAGMYELSDGDVVEFVYTCDMGNDL